MTPWSQRFRATDAAVIMKLGRHLPKVREALKEAGLHDRAVYVERGTMADEFICPLPQKDRRRGAVFRADPRARPGATAVSAPARSPSSGLGPGNRRMADACRLRRACARHRSRRLRPLSRPRARRCRTSAGTPPTTGSRSSAPRLALDLAAQGRHVAVVSGGDPGVFAMAAAVFEALDGGDPAWRRVADHGRARHHRDARRGGPPRRSARRRFLRHFAVGQSQALGRDRDAARRPR